MSIESKPPIIHYLKAVIVKGKEMVAKQIMPVGPGNAWIMRTRAILGRIYGENSTEVNFWCPNHKDDPIQWTGHYKIDIRIPNLERLVTILSTPQDNSKIFIGHGRSKEWKDLYIFFFKTLGLPCDEFNIEPTAGLQTSSRIECMLTSAGMAFLVMTAEDRHSDGKLHARENVIHEIGLFQAKLGPQKAIIMLENGCNIPSNLNGLTVINFPSGDLMARSQAIRDVLLRERFLLK
ncbi:MAG: TIR domain-containing protein [Candidatus Methylumidiphilus sp.]